MKFPVILFRVETSPPKENLSRFSLEREAYQFARELLEESKHDQMDNDVYYVEYISMPERTVYEVYEECIYDANIDCPQFKTICKTPDEFTALFVCGILHERHHKRYVYDEKRIHDEYDLRTISKSIISKYETFEDYVKNERIK